MHRKILVFGFILLFCLKSLILHAQTLTAGVATGTIVSCAGTASVSPNLQQIVVTGSALSSNITATAPANFELSLTATGTFANTIALPQAGGTVYIRSAATAQAGNLSGYVSFSSSGANTVSVQVNSIVNALPVVNPINNQTFTGGNLTTPVNFTGTAQAYQWTNDNPSIGIGASGFGNIPSFTAINNGTSPITANFTVTPQSAGFIFTANTSANSVSMINTSTNAVTATIPVGINPNFTLVSPNQRAVYVGCTNEIDVLDALSGNIITKIAINAPFFDQINISPDGNTLYVITGGTATQPIGQLWVINTTTYQVTTKTNLPKGLIPSAMVSSPDGSRLYVTDEGGFIYVIDTSTNTIINTIQTTLSPTAMVMSPDGSRLYITEWHNTDQKDILEVFNTITNTTIGTITLDIRPQQPVINSDGSRVYVPNLLSGDVSVINTVTNSLISNIIIGDLTTYTKACVLSSDDKFLYVLNQLSKSVSVINTSNNTLISTIPVSGSLLINLSISPDGTHLYIPDNDNNVINVISTITNAFITAVPVGKSPVISNQSITKGNGCNGTVATFTITILPNAQTITESGSPNPFSTSYGTPSASASITVSGAHLTAPLILTLPTGFEASTDNINFSNTITLNADATGTVATTTIYIRLAAIAPAGNYTGNLVLKSTGASDVNVPLTGQVIPSMINLTAGVATGTIVSCVGSPSVSPNLQQIVVTGSALSSNITATAPANFELSLTATGTFANTITLPQAGGTVYVRSAATAQAGSLSGYVNFSAAGVNAVSVLVNATVNALPVANPINNQTITGGNLTAPVNFTGTTKAYQWTNDNPSIGIGASGSGNIPSFTAINNGSSPITAHFTVTPQSAGFIFAATGGNAVSMINTNTNAVAATIPVGSGPYITLVNPNQREVYVGYAYQNEIDALDALSGNIITKIATYAGIKLMATSPDGSILYAIGFPINEQDATLYIINTTTHTITTFIDVDHPLSMLVSPDGSRLYVEDSESFVYVIDTATNTIISTINIPLPEAMTISPDGSRLYVTELIANSMHTTMDVINTATNTVIATIPFNTATQAQPVINTDGSLIYLPCFLTNNILVVNTATNSVVATIPNPNANFNADYIYKCVLSRDGQLLYFISQISQSESVISVISTASNTVIKTIPINGAPNNIVLSPDGTHLYLSDNSASVVHIISTATNTLITDVPVGSTSVISNQSISTGSGCNGTPVTFTITVLPDVPIIAESGSPNPFSTSYGTPSVAAGITVSGAHLTAPLTLTLPTGFEVSTDNSNFSNTITLSPDATGAVAATTIYIRLSAGIPAGNYTGNLVLKSTGASDVNVPLTGQVTPAMLTITAIPVTKIYGATLTGGAGSTAFTITGLQNGETVGTVTLTYGDGSAAGAPAGVYNTSLVPSAATGGNFNAGNYNITYVPASITVNQASLLITVNNASRAFATPNPTFTVTYAGFVNNEDPEQLITLPVISTTATLTSPTGQYPIIASSAFSPNYAISYVPGILTIYADPRDIKIPNAFTPNGDGINDLWDINDLQYYPNCTVEIYNRDGKHLYHSRGYGQAWDGTSNGQQLPLGTYYYIISLNDGTSIKFIGYVAIIK